MENLSNLSDFLLKHSARLEIEVDPSCIESDIVLVYTNMCGENSKINLDTYFIPKNNM